MNAPIPEDLRARVSDALYHGRKIEAIKWYRELTGTGLAEAKRVVEQCEAELRAATPEKFVGRPKNTVLRNLVCYCVIAAGFAIVCVKSAVHQSRGEEKASLMTWMSWFMLAVAIFGVIACFRELRKLPGKP
jgi:hypothetical protein